MRRRRECASMIDATKLVRRAPFRPLVWLGERERGGVAGPGERFPAYLVKERDMILDLEGARSRR